VASATSQAPRQQAPIRVPQSISEVDNGKILGFGADLAEDHPGWGDRAYAQRRVDICNTARAHEIGRPIPEVEYSAEETATWGKALNELVQLYPTAACREFLASFPAFGFTPDRVPQLQDLTEVLERETGWRIRPVAGLLHPRDFLNGLAFKTFHSTQYVRHASQPSYTPEPDVIHELLGHVPMLVDPAFCDLVHNIGVASLGADEKEIWHLTKIYWYTVEFGVVREGNGIKAFGAGILSSYGELQHMLAGRAELVDFNPFAKQPKMSYKVWACLSRSAWSRSQLSVRGVCTGPHKWLSYLVVLV